jgi:small conductance mechanosensitive channel
MLDANPYTTVLPAVAGALLAAAVVWVLLRLATRAIDRFAARLEREGLLEEGAIFAKRLTRFVRSTLSLVVALAAGVTLLRGVGLRGMPRISADDLVAWLIGPGLRLVVIAIAAYLVTKCIHFLIDSLQILFVSRDLTQTHAALLERKKRVDTLGQLLRVVATLLVVGIASLMALSLFSVDIRPILTGAGIAGLAVGFGAQNLVRDVIAGFFLILEDQVRLGDVVSINGKSGLVEAIRLRTIALRGNDGTVHIFPNGVITELSNMTKDFSYAVLDVGIPYHVDVDAAVAVLREIAIELRADPEHGPSILEPLEVLGVESLSEISVVLRVRIKTVPIQQWNVGREFRRRIKLAFDARGIGFPSRTVTVHLAGTGQALKPDDLHAAEKV